MNNRIDQRFDALRNAARCGLIPFITAGDPEPRATVPVMHSLVRGGADLLELGVPFSDPMADGPVIQASSERAIQRGTSLASVLEMVAAFRQDDQQTPVILMGYMNPVERLGYAARNISLAAARAPVLVWQIPGSDRVRARDPPFSMSDRESQSGDAERGPGRPPSSTFAAGLRKDKYA